MGKILIIKGADFSKVAVGKVEPTPPSPVGTPVITISTSGVVTIACEGATEIYYTTNGSTPTTGSTKYTTAFNVSSGTTVKTIAKFANGTTSSVVSKTYSITWYSTIGTQYAESAQTTGNFGRSTATEEQYYGPASYTSLPQGKPVNVVKLFFSKNDKNQGRYTEAEFAICVMKVGDTVSDMREPLAVFHVSADEWAAGEKQLDITQVTLGSDEYIGVAMTQVNTSEKACVVPVGIGDAAGGGSLYGTPLAVNNSYTACIDIGYSNIQ